VDQLNALARELPVVFPMHPRTRARVEALGLRTRFHCLEPLGYLDFLALQSSAAGVLTDSGGVQEETTFFGVPCFTLRDNTERPVTVRAGTNRLLGLAPERIADILPALESDARAAYPPPDGWDGRAAERLVGELASGLVATAPAPGLAVAVQEALEEEPPEAVAL
jgi:UDP-N-acetylglucosamine 2-epimerase (non-hydrolysing)